MVKGGRKHKKQSQNIFMEGEDDTKAPTECLSGKKELMPIGKAIELEEPRPETIMTAVDFKDPITK